MIENYKTLCTIYYDADKPLPPKEEYIFYKFFLEKYKNNILEPMCGSGRFLIPFLQNGYEIDSFDASYPMIESLKHKLIKYNLNTKYQHCTFDNFIFKKKYNLIYIPSASLSLIYKKYNFIKTIKKIYNHLERLGSFIFEVETHKILENDKSDFKLISTHLIKLSEDKKILGSFINHSYINNVLTISCRYDLISDSIINTEFEDIIIRLFNYEEIINILKNIGFEVICYKNFQKDIYNSIEQLPKLLILECIKQ